MADTLSDTTTRAPRLKKPREPRESEARAPRKPRRPAERGERSERGRARETVALAALWTWLDELDLGGIKPGVHVNGHQFTATALITVDLGQPLKPMRLTADQTHALGERLRAAAKEVLGRDAPVRVHHDAPRGIVWTSLT